MKLALDVPARIPLAPVLLTQALLVRRRAQMLPEPPGFRAGVAGNGRPLRLLILGDSSAAGVGAPTQESALSGQLVENLRRSFRVTWQLEASTGATTSATLDTLARMPKQPFDVAVTALGVNDVTRAVPCHRWIARQTALHELLRRQFCVRRILVTGMPPMGRFPLLPQPLRWVLGQQADRFDRALQALLEPQIDAEHVAVNFPDDPRFAATDGFHPSADAYAHWAEILAERIARSGD